MRNQRQGVRSTKRALTPNLSVLLPEESETVAGLTNAPLEAGPAGQFLGENFHTSQGAAGGPSEIPKPIGAVAELKNAPMVAGTAAQIPGDNFHTSQAAAGDPSEILKPIPYISIEEPVALEKKIGCFSCHL